jgi:hypothetical protein
MTKLSTNMRVRVLGVNRDEDNEMDVKYSLQVWIDEIKVFDGVISQNDMGNAFLSQLEDAYYNIIGDELEKKGLHRYLCREYKIVLTAKGKLYSLINAVIYNVTGHKLNEGADWIKIVRK